MADTQATVRAYAKEQFCPVSIWPDIVPEEPSLQEARSDAEQWLARSQAIQEAEEVISACSIEVGKDVAWIILDVIGREHIDMAVIITQGLSTWHPFAFSSIAEKVVRLAQCQLFLLRTENPENKCEERVWPFHGMAVAKAVSRSPVASR